MTQLLPNKAHTGLTIVFLLLCTVTSFNPLHGQNAISYQNTTAIITTPVGINELNGLTPTTIQSPSLSSPNLCPQPGFDYTILYNLQQHRTPTINRTMQAVSSSVFFVPVVPASMAIAGWATQNKSLLVGSVQVSGSLALTSGVSLALKAIVARPRPYNAYAETLVPITTENSYSFPSAHTAFAFATATSLALQYPKWYVTIPAFGWASIVGYSRMYLGVHYPTDVLCGALIGAASAYFTYWLQQRYMKINQLPEQEVVIAPISITF